jgi:hypothetical protein
LFGNFVVLSFPDYQLVTSFFGKFVGIVWELFGNFVGISWEFERECFRVLKGSEKKNKKNIKKSVKMFFSTKIVFIFVKEIL